MRSIICCLLLTVSMLIPSVINAEEIQKHSKIPKEIYYKFIKSENKTLSKDRVRDIYHAVEYYNPRYFGVDGEFEEGILWTLAAMAQESSFRNINGDGGLSIGYLQIQIPTCNAARKYNGIKRELNIHKLWDNIHCGMSELNRLHELLNGDWELSIRAYNAGIGCVNTSTNKCKYGQGGALYWDAHKDDEIKTKFWKKLDRLTTRHLTLVNKRKNRLINRINEYKELNGGNDGEDNTTRSM